MVSKEWETAGLSLRNVTQNRKNKSEKERVIGNFFLKKQSFSLQKAHRQCICHHGCSEVKVPIW